MLNQNTIRIACFGQELIIPNQRPLNERDMPKSRRKGYQCHKMGEYSLWDRPGHVNLGYLQRLPDIL